MCKKVVFILGPTASGKSDLAFTAAKKFQAEIINADSIQVFEDLDIGSAKPTQEELKQVSHHLIGHIAKGHDYTSGQFRKDVLSILETSLHDRFLIVGGSGFYLKGLTQGLYEIPPIPADIHLNVQSTCKELLYAELQKVDPLSAQKLHANDTYRIQRAIEVYRTFQKPLSAFKESFSEKTFPFSYIKIGMSVPRDELRSRVQIRVQKMIDLGFIEETQRLLDQGYHSWRALQSVGYKEVILYLKGLLKYEELIPEIVKNTMGLAKRQMTWFRKDPEIQWSVSGAEQKSALDSIQKFFEDKEVLGLEKKNNS